MKLFRAAFQINTTPEDQFRVAADYIGKIVDGRRVTGVKITYFKGKREYPIVLFELEH